MGIYSKKMVYTRDALVDFSSFHSRRVSSPIVTLSDREKDELIKKKYFVLCLFLLSLSVAPRIALKMKCQTACKPGSVPARAGDDHSSGTPVTGRLSRPTRMATRKPA